MARGDSPGHLSYGTASGALHERSFTPGAEAQYLLTHVWASVGL